jgi:hypothetical protein
MIRACVSRLHTFRVRSYTIELPRSLICIARLLFIFKYKFSFVLAGFWTELVDGDRLYQAASCWFTVTEKHRPY